MKKSPGFTYIETLISMTIITLICVLLYYCFFVSTKSASKTKDKIHSYIEHISFDNDLRSYINSICVPEWVDDYKFTYSKNMISTQWNNGLETDSKFIVPAPFKITSISPIIISDKVTGFDISYSSENEDYVCSCLFATIPYNNKNK